MRRLFLGSGRSVLQGIQYPSYGTERALKRLFIQDFPDFGREIRVGEWLENDFDAGI